MSQFWGAAGDLWCMSISFFPVFPANLSTVNLLIKALNVQNILKKKKKERICQKENWVDVEQFVQAWKYLAKQYFLLPSD